MRRTSRELATLLGEAQVGVVIPSPIVAELLRELILYRLQVPASATALVHLPPGRVFHTMTGQGVPDLSARYTLVSTCFTLASNPTVVAAPDDAADAAATRMFRAWELVVPVREKGASG